MRPDHRPRLYAITPDENDTPRLLAQVGQVLAGGASILQYRNKTASPTLRLEQALAIQTLCQRYDVPLIINDHLDLAIAINAEGLHLGGDDGDIAAARAALGPTKWLGASCYNRLELAHTAVAAGANYVAFGAMFRSKTKPNAAVASLDLLTDARQQLDCPICAIGGITSENIGQVRVAGADWIAVVGSIFQAENIQTSTQTLVGAMKNYK